jgi:fructokinase
MEANRKVVCFGEILFDILPTGKKAGGAPMNVAYHLHTLGINSVMISKVGNDKNGAELLQFLNKMGLSTDYCQIDKTAQTSEVLAKILDNHEVTYDILYPVAWDYISWDEKFDSLLADADAFVFGSLSARHEITRETLFRMLEKQVYKVFDVNLRVPHYSKEIIGELLERADLVKLNLHELKLAAQWFEGAAKTEFECINALQEHFEINEIIVTKGSRGASYYTPSLRYDYPAYRVEVNDTVGSGDSFLAAFLSKKLKGAALETTLEYSAALGAYITMQSGACPDYSELDLERFLWKNELVKINRLLNK